VLQQVFCWGFILLCGWAGITPFCMIEFENIMMNFADVCFAVFRLSLSHLRFCSIWLWGKILSGELCPSGLFVWTDRVGWGYWFVNVTKQKYGQSFVIFLLFANAAEQ
jgi:hypothetical protein